MAAVQPFQSQFNIVAAPTLQPDLPQKVLFLAQQINNTSPPEQIIRNILPGQENALFGAKSQLAAGIRAFRTVNNITQVDALPFNEPLGALSATATLVVGTVTGFSGVLQFFIQSKTNHLFTINIVSTDTEIEIATKITNAINADPLVLATADNGSPATATVTITALPVGFSGNIMPFGILNPAGVAALGLVWTQFSGGLGSPDMSTLATLVGETRYQWFVTPDSYGLTDLSNFIDARFNTSPPQPTVLDGRVIQALVADEPTAIALATNTNSSQNMVLLSNNVVNGLPFRSGGAIPELVFCLAGIFAGIASLRLTQGANLSSVVPANATQTGDIGSAPIPYAGTIFPNVATGVIGDNYTSVQQATLANSGITVVGNNIANNAVILAKTVTTYLVDPQTSLPSTTWKYLTAVITASVIREFYVNNNDVQFRQSVLTDGSLVANRRQVNIQSFNAFQVSLYQVLANQYGLVPISQAAISAYKNNLNTTVDFQTGVINCLQIIPINEGLQGITGTIEIAFSVQTT